MSEPYAGLQDHYHEQVDKRQKILRKLRKKYLAEFNRINRAYRARRDSLSEADRARGDALYKEARRLARRVNKLRRKTRKNAYDVDGFVKVLEVITDPTHRALLHIRKIKLLMEMLEDIKKMIDSIREAADIYNVLQTILHGK